MLSDLANFVKKYWPAIAIIIIVILGVYVRTLDYRWPYLRNIDSYTFFRHMDEIVMNGGISPTWDNLVFAPDGLPRSPQLYPYQYLGAWSYMFFHLFFPDMQLWQYLIYFPAALGALAAVPMYFIGKTLYDRRAGVLAAFFITFDISNFSRSLAGDPDSDAIVILVPLIVMALFLLTYKYVSTKKIIDKKAVVYSVVTAISLVIWTSTWIGYWYVVWLIIGFFITMFIYKIISLRNIKSVYSDMRPVIISYIIFLSIYFILITAIHGSGKIPYTFYAPFEFQEIKSEEGIDFPNVYVSVAELQGSGDIKDIIQRTSVINFNQTPLLILITPFFLMVYGIVYMIYSYIRKGEHLDTVILLLIWFIGPLTATIMAVRFSILFSAPVAIGSAIFLVKLYSWLTNEKV